MNRRKMKNTIQIGNLFSKSVYFMVFHLGNLFWMDYAALFSPAYTVLNAESRKQIQGDLVMHREASLHYRG